MGYRVGEMAGKGLVIKSMVLVAGGVGTISRNPVVKCMVENCRFCKSWGGGLQIYGFMGRVCGNDSSQSCGQVYG